tara:strand:- start:193 stop:549 length:357 start_codon:yes stop_codon:yes gene_type:complete
MSKFLKYISYHLRKLFIWAFEARLLHFAVYEAERLIEKKLNGNYQKKDIEKFGENLIKKVAKKSFEQLHNSSQMITNSSCNGLLDNFKLEFNPGRKEVRFNVDGSDLLRFDLLKRIFK